MCKIINLFSDSYYSICAKITKVKALLLWLLKKINFNDFNFFKKKSDGRNSVKLWAGFWGVIVGSDISAFWDLSVFLKHLSGHMANLTVELWRPHLMQHV